MPSRALDAAVAVVAAGAVVLGAQEAGRDTMRAAEVRCFTGLNATSDRALRPVWLVMQLGSLGGSLATGGVVVVAGQPRLGRRLAIVGTLGWLGSKVVKPVANRGRPATLLGTARIRGREQTGLGYPSGHAAVAVGMAAAAVSIVPPALRAPLWLSAVGVGAARVYVGAHLPLDVLGGMALGLASERTLRFLMGRV